MMEEDDIIIDEGYPGIAGKNLNSSDGDIDMVI